MIKYIFIVSNGNFNNSLLIICRNDAAIVFVFGNITSNKVQGIEIGFLKLYLTLLSSTENSAL